MLAGMCSDRPSHIPPPGDPATLRKLREALAQAPAGAVFSGLTAAWLHGLEVDPLHPIEMIIPVERPPRRGGGPPRRGR